MNETYQKYVARMRKITDLIHSRSVLGWDQEVYMPEKGGQHRAQQIATLSGIIHDLSADEELGGWLKDLVSNDSLSEKEKRNINESLRQYEHDKKYSTAFVEKKSMKVSECFQAWQQAKKENDFKSYAPKLNTLLDIIKEESELLGYEEHPYDPLLDNYEPNAKTKEIDELFSNVKAELVDFVKNISEAKQNEHDFLYKHYDKDKQWDFGIDLLQQMGYDFKAGRQDISAHPFTTNFSPLDVRVTTRITENDLTEMTTGTIHEGGHALYEQGLNIEDYGLPTGEFISLGMHESQSRLWENHVGRSLEYWKANFPALQKLFPENLAGLQAEDLYKAFNIVKPDFVRTSADELTYHFHIMIRFEIEKALVEGQLKVDDLPAYWNAKYKEYLGLNVPSDTLGVLQDVHWSHGSFGYFPTYSLGSFYAAQFYQQAEKDIPELAQQIEAGNMQKLVQWLRTNIHQHGKYYSAQELCEEVTGEKLNFDYFMNYARNKYQELYPELKDKEGVIS